MNVIVCNQDPYWISPEEHVYQVLMG